MKNRMSSLEIKHALLSYFRFKRQWLCASECISNDVMVITNKDIIIEVEVKINKYDLWKGEAKKGKHELYKQDRDFMPNKFYICVPEELIEEAKKWVKATNNKYGIIHCLRRYNNLLPHEIFIAKSAETLHIEKNEYLKHKIIMRICSENIGLIGNLLSSRDKNIAETIYDICGKNVIEEDISINKILGNE